MATIFAAFAELERAKISRRTRAAILAKIARGELANRPRKYPKATVNKMRRMRGRGESYQDIAAKMNDAGIPTLSGGQWDKQRVFDTLKRYGREAA